MIVKLARAFFAHWMLWTVIQTLPIQVSRAEESPSNSSYQRVTANLDPGGVIYLYWSAEKALGELDKKLEAVRDLAASDPGLSPDEKNNLRKNFDLGIRLILRSGIQRVKAFGLSSREIEPGLFLNKTYTYFPDRAGFLWDSFAKAPHNFPFVKMLPENTEGFTFFDFDLASTLGRALPSVGRLGDPGKPEMAATFFATGPGVYRVESGRFARLARRPGRPACDVGSEGHGQNSPWERTIRDARTSRRIGLDGQK